MAHLEHFKNAACSAALQHLEQVIPPTRQPQQGKLLKREPQGALRWFQTHLLSLFNVMHVCAPQGKGRM